MNMMLFGKKDKLLDLVAKARLARIEATKTRLVMPTRLQKPTRVLTYQIGYERGLREAFNLIFDEKLKDLFHEPHRSHPKSSKEGVRLLETKRRSHRKLTDSEKSLKVRAKERLSALDDALNVHPVLRRQRSKRKTDRGHRMPRVCQTRGRGMGVSKTKAES
jgi:hypothetical protein